jgi:Ser/Thr protein kinase RdoA (MazF antagonist)/acetylornithine/succinyldiaminopimelate/putrescine aminotransferase
MSLVQSAPRFDTQHAATLAQKHFGVVGATRLLPSERDQNFCIENAAGESYVLKIANATESYALLDAQNHALERMASAGISLPSPAVARTLNGDTIAQIHDIDGQRYFARLLRYIPGAPLATVRPHAPELLANLGRFLGRVDRALAGYDHPALHRTFHWDLAHAAAVVRAHIDEIAAPARRALVQALLARFEAETAPRLDALPRQVIHGDANDYNVLVANDGDLFARYRHIAGILDLGDMVHSLRVADLAIAAAYALLDKPDPLQVVAQVTAGYHAVNPLTDAELAALWDLTCMRLCVSVCHAAHQRALQPENEYLSISERPAWAALEKLVQIHPRLAHYTLRAACNLSAVPHSGQIEKWLSDHPGGFAPVIGVDLRTAPTHVLDLSVGSTTLTSAMLRSDRTDLLTAAIFGEIAEQGAAVGIGRYAEARPFYTGPTFTLTSSPTEERRTLHLGIDLFASPGTPICAPLAGIVHALRDNPARHDYGPVVILRHTTNAGHNFYTLYGHLGRECLTQLTAGQNVATGEAFAAIGAPPINGDWPPHLHFQLITDLLELECDFPGVAAPSQAALWMKLSPDPNVLLGIPAERFPASSPTPETTLRERRARIGRSLSISYHQPIKVVRGLAQYLYDEGGRAYLDGVNNVAHVGHCHPYVVAAGQRQMAVLNTNTRYLHDAINEYARRLAATLPPTIARLLLPQLRQRGQRSGASPGAHHHRATGCDHRRRRLSRPHAGADRDQPLQARRPRRSRTPLLYPKGDSARPLSWPLPRLQRDVRSPIRRPRTAGGGADSGGRGAVSLHSSVSQRPAAAGKSSFQQATWPKPFVTCARQAASVSPTKCRSVLARVGSHFWGFQTQGVVPDIVTMGKPAGNGHPLAIVATTPEIADRFANGMEYFNTFGGNPVSCAIGLAVLDVIEQEGLQANALDVGNYLMAGLRDLQTRHPLIGNVRGLGLYIGAELVLDPETMEPAGEHASYISNRMRDYGVLISTDGPFHNVLKLKPPIIFSRADADHLLWALNEVLQDSALT